MLTDVEEKITTTEIDPLTKQENIRVILSYLTFLDIKESPFINIFKRRSCDISVSFSIVMREKDIVDN